MSREQPWRYREPAPPPGGLGGLRRALV